MKLSKQVKQVIEKSVLCWLATSSTDHMPNVSPKECFTFYEDDKIIVANIASPTSVSNIRKNEKVCISFIDILVQKGFQIKGTATIIEQDDHSFLPYSAIFQHILLDQFPITNIIEIQVGSIKPILAPSYIFNPKTTEQDQIESAKRQYGIRELD